VPCKAAAIHVAARACETVAASMLHADRDEEDANILDLVDALQRSRVSSVSRRRVGDGTECSVGR
jgi:hypothetical protein